MSFSEGSISWDKNALLATYNLGISNYRHYFMVYNKQNKNEQKSYTFMQDLNAFVLQCLLKTIIKEHQIASSDTISDTHP